MFSLKKIILIIIVALIIGGGTFVWWESKEPQTEETIKDKIFSVIAGFDFTDPNSFHSVSGVSELGDKSVSILKDLIKSKNISERWAAVILLPQLLRDDKISREDVVPSLKETANDSDDTLKMLTGVQLASLGEKEGIKILISCLDSEQTTHFGEPPELVKDRSLIYLMHYTDFKGTTSQEWQTWWGNNNNFLSWNKKQNIFEIKK
jgi:hypothetical protein